MEIIFEIPKKSTNTDLFEWNDTRLKFNGLNTSLNPTFILNTTMHGSDNLKGFLSELEITLLKEDFWCRRFDLPNNKTRYIQEFFQNLKIQNCLCYNRQNQLHPIIPCLQLTNTWFLTNFWRRPTSIYTQWWSPCFSKWTS